MCDGKNVFDVHKSRVGGNGELHPAMRERIKQCFESRKLDPVEKVKVRPSSVVDDRPRWVVRMEATLERWAAWLFGAS